MDAANLAVGWSMRVLHTVRFMDTQPAYLLYGQDLIWYCSFKRTNPLLALLPADTVPLYRKFIAAMRRGSTGIEVV